MEFRNLGKSGLRISSISFGAGPISSLMVGADRDAQRLTGHKAFEAGVTWFDTAASYAEGDSERSLGRVVRAHCGTGKIHVATKVRLLPQELDDIESAVFVSVKQSLARLGVERVSLLQLHNSITAKRGDLPTSVTVDDVLGKNGVVAAFERLRGEGLVDHFGFTGLGDTQSLDAIVESQVFTSAQVPLSLLTPVAEQ